MLEKTGTIDARDNLLWRHAVGLAQLLGRVTARDQSREPTAHEQFSALDGKTRPLRKAAN